MVDSADRERVAESREELSQVCESPEMAGVPVVVIANKQDLPGESTAVVGQHPCMDPGAVLGGGGGVGSNRVGVGGLALTELGGGGDEEEGGRGECCIGCNGGGAWPVVSTPVGIQWAVFAVMAAPLWCVLAVMAAPLWCILVVMSAPLWCVLAVISAPPWCVLAVMSAPLWCVLAVISAPPWCVLAVMAAPLWCVLVVMSAPLWCVLAVISAPRGVYWQSCQHPCGVYWQLYQHPRGVYWKSCQHPCGSSVGCIGSHVSIAVAIQGDAFNWKTRATTPVEVLVAKLKKRKGKKKNEKREKEGRKKDQNTQIKRETLLFQTDKTIMQIFDTTALASDKQATSYRVTQIICREKQKRFNFPQLV